MWVLLVGVFLRGSRGPDGTCAYFLRLRITHGQHMIFQTRSTKSSKLAIHFIPSLSNEEKGWGATGTSTEGSHAYCSCASNKIFLKSFLHADIMRDIVQLLRERIDQGLLTVFIKIKAHRANPLNEQADRWADEGRQSENIRWSLPTNVGLQHLVCPCATF